MEVDFSKMDPYLFISKYTEEIKKSKTNGKGTEVALEMIRICGDSKPHLNIFKILSKPHRNILRARCIPKYRKEYMKFHLKTERTECEYCVCPKSLEAGDHCILSEKFFSEEEREMFLSKVTPYNIYMYLGEKLMKLHVWVLRNEVRKKKKWALMLHGFGIECTKHDWMKWCFDLYNRGNDILMIDFPGFGRSSGRDLQSITWKGQSNLMLWTVMKYFGCTRSVSVFADCGGAATFLKLLVSKPRVFSSKRHVLIRPVIGSWPRNLERVLEKFSIGLWVTWIVDPCHPLDHAAQKNWNRVSKSHNLKAACVKYYLQDGFNGKLIGTYDTQFAPGISRTQSSYNLFRFEERYFARIFQWFDKC